MQHDPKKKGQEMRPNIYIYVFSNGNGLVPPGDTIREENRATSKPASSLGHQPRAYFILSRVPQLWGPGKEHMFLTVCTIDLC